MSLYRRGDSWQCRIVRDGVKYQKALGAMTKNEAKEEQTKFLAEIIRGEIAAKTPTLKQFGEKFKAHLPSRVRASSIRLYEQCWAHLVEEKSPLANLELNEITREVVDRFAQQKRESGLAVITVNSLLRTLRKALFLAFEWHLLTSAPRRVVRLLPGENQREFVLDTDTAEKICKVLFGQMRDVVRFAIDSGLRAGEICNLTWNDVDYSGEDPVAVRIREGKTKFARRRVPLTNRSAAILTALRANVKDGVPYVFTRYKGNQPLTVEWMSGRFKRARRVVGVSEDCKFHSLRHTACTRWAVAGASAFEIRMLAGHSSIVISSRYTHPEEEQLKAAIARMGK
jgi:integrase